MERFINSNDSTKIEGKKVGTVHVSMYKDTSTSLPFFFIHADNEDMLQVSYIIEDSLKILCAIFRLTFVSLFTF